MELTQRVGRFEEHLEQLTAVVSQLATAQLRTEQRIEELAAAQARTEAELERLAAAQARTEEQMEKLAAAQTRTEGHLEALRTWQQGESGWRRGERYERSTARGPAVLFGPGEGGTADHDMVRRRLTDAVNSLPAERVQALTAEADPFRADVVYWKHGCVGVVEVSLVVEIDDVDRAHKRADTLSLTGANALPVVVGESWADLEVRALADMLRLAWHVGSDVNDRFKEFRALPAEATPPPPR